MLRLLLLAGVLAPAACLGGTTVSESTNLIPNGDFARGAAGRLPDGWSATAMRPSLLPAFRLVKEDGRQLLLAAGTGNPHCVGYVSARAPITLGRTYRFRVLFKVSRDLNPCDNLLFQCFGPGARDGIFRFRRLPDGWIEGDTLSTWAGQGAGEAEIRILFRLSARGKAWIRQVSLVESEPAPQRWVRVACTQGKTDLKSCEAILDAVGKAGADLVLLPEYLQGGRIEEPLEGPSFALMSAKAKEYRMYVAGGIVRKDAHADLVYNTALLFDRQGRLAGTYDKVHPYSPEINEEGITPGERVPVFRTDFGKVGIMICYDSWFTDVAELLALRGAEIILFPNAGYYRALMPARAADNRVRIVCSTWGGQNGIWDTVGRDVSNPNADTSHGNPPGITFKDVSQQKVAGVGVLTASLDLSCSPSPHHNGGTMYEAPGGRRNRREQSTFLDEQIRKERERWWEEEGM